jgi:hypothetical protein
MQKFNADQARVLKHFLQCNSAESDMEEFLFDFYDISISIQKLHPIRALLYSLTFERTALSKSTFQPPEPEFINVLWRLKRYLFN